MVNAQGHVSVAKEMNITKEGDTNTIDLRFGSSFLISNTSDAVRDVFMPTFANIRSILRKDSFAFQIDIETKWDCKENIRLFFQDPFDAAR